MRYKRAEDDETLFLINIFNTKKLITSHQLSLVCIYIYINFSVSDKFCLDYAVVRNTPQS